MPLSHLPARARAKAAATDASPDWLGLWALSLGASAIVMAAIAYFAGGDAIGAAAIMAGAAGVIMAMLYGGQPRAVR